MLALALILSLLAAGCSGSSNGDSSNGDMTLTIGSRGTPEEVVLGHIYAQALKAVGYKVKGDFDIEDEYPDAPLEELKSGRISAYPEHANTALGSFLDVEDDNLPAGAQEAFQQAKAKFEKEGLTAFPPTPFSLDRPVGVLKKTAEELGLKTVSDLKGRSEKMMLWGPTDCHLQTADCLGGMEKHYGIVFDGIKYTYTPRDIRRRYKVLENGEVDASILYSTDGRLAVDGGKFVTLEDDKHVFRAGNVIFVTSQKVVEEAGPDFEETILAAQKGLTLPVMQRLDAAVEIEKKDPEEVAADYLKTVDLTE